MLIRWTQGARADLLDIVRHIAKDRPDTARAVAFKIRGTVQQLVGFSELGRMVPEFGDAALRECIIRPYRVIYRLGENQIEVLAVVHGRRLIANPE